MLCQPPGGGSILFRTRTVKSFLLPPSSSAASTGFVFPSDFYGPSLACHRLEPFFFQPDPFPRKNAMPDKKSSTDRQMPSTPQQRMAVLRLSSRGPRGSRRLQRPRSLVQPIASPGWLNPGPRLTSQNLAADLPSVHPSIRAFTVVSNSSLGPPSITPGRVISASHLLRPGSIRHFLRLLSPDFPDPAEPLAHHPI